MPDQLRYDGKVALITGAGNGLGRIYALMFAARGAKVVVNDLGGSGSGEGQSASAADRVVEEIRAAGGTAVANHDSVIDGERIVQTALDAFGTLDIVVNNAGILRDASFAKMSEHDWTLIYQVHVHGAFKVTHAAWPILREKSYGRVLFTTSAAGIYGNFGQANYSMAKLGLLGFAQTLAEEGRARNIHVNTIAPIAASRLTETILPPEILARLSPECVSPLVGWLCHEDCMETKGLFEVGAGYIGKLRWERSAGRMFRTGRRFDVEEVAAGWPQIVDFGAGSTHPATIAESAAPLMANANAPSRGGNAFLDLDKAFAHVIESESHYDERDLALYALGVGAARDPLADDRKLAYELDSGFQALPTYAVIPAVNSLLAMVREGRMVDGLDFGMERALHGEQFVELMRPLPPKARLRHRFRLAHAYDKAPHALLVFGVETFDETDTLLARNEISLFVRDIGGWGGERGPSGDANPPPTRAPDVVVEETTDANQTLLYRLSGDWNPLHADPAFAKAFGFERPILHGLCTFGFAARHAIGAFCGGDGRRFRSIKARFADSVYPGETLVTRLWKESDTRIVFETRVKERDTVVLRNAAIELYREIPTVEAPAAVAVENAAQPSGPTSADVFAAIAQHLADNPGLGERIKTVFAFHLREPDSTWTLDLKTGDGAVRAGAPDKPDVSLTLAERDFIAMSTREADANKLYFDGRLKIAGNVIASQKLDFLRKIDPRHIADAAKRRLGDAGTQPVAPDVAGETGSADLFAAIGAYLGAHPELPGTIGAVFQWNLTEPSSRWQLDLKNGAGTCEPGVAAKADCTLELADADFVAMATGKADPQKLFLAGRLKISGNVLASQKLEFLKKVDTRGVRAGATARTAAAAAAAPKENVAHSAAIFASLAQRVRDDADFVAAITAEVGALLQFQVRSPQRDWIVDLRPGHVLVREGSTADAAAAFTLDDADLCALADGSADARDRFQRGALRIDGDMRYAHRLAFLTTLAQTLYTEDAA